MSATNRGATRHELDWYETPVECVWLLLDHVGFDGAIIDAGCGTGPIGKALIDDGYEAVGVELDHGRVEQSRAKGLVVIEGDYLAMNLVAENVVSNPPYSLASNFIRKSLDIVKPGGKVAMLLRLNFLGSSRGRQDLFKQGSGFKHIVVMSIRPSFKGGGTDMCEYAWLVWERGYVGVATVEVR